MRNALTLAVTCLALSACSASQLASVQLYSGTACADLPVVLAVDKPFATHNPQVVADLNTACAVAPGVISTIPVKPAPSTP